MPPIGKATMELSPLWEGLWGALISAAVAAAVAVLAVRLTARADRSHAEERDRRAAFAQMRGAMRACWEVAGRDFEYYEAQGVPMNAIPKIIRRKDYDMESRVSELRLAFDLWSLTINETFRPIVEATERAITTLHGEWVYASYIGSSTLQWGIPKEFINEWETYSALAKEWHQVQGRPREKLTGQFNALWRLPHHTLEDGIQLAMDFGADVRHNPWGSR